MRKDFVKQHEELFDKTHEKFKDNQRKERLWKTVPGIYMSVM